jgi:nucleotide-binding universal stress UspA family protein
MIKTKIKKILVALDGSKNSYRGLDMGIYLARQCNTKLVGIYVISNIPNTYKTSFDSSRGHNGNCKDTLCPKWNFI